MPKRGERTDPKTSALREDGTLNPAPERVSDPKFQTSDFFDSRDLMQVRYEMLRRVSIDNLSVTRATAEYGVSRPTYYQAKASFDEAGLGGLVPKKRGPRGPRKLQGDILAFVEKQIVPGKPLRARELARRIRQAFSIEVHPRTIERALGGKKTTQRAPEPVLNKPRRGEREGAVRNIANGRSWRTAPPRSEERSCALASARHVGVGADSRRPEHDTPSDAIVASGLDPR
ncbi:helix-turn-helix domain-containing protein [Sorangium sp. So ce1097]|uniref:helix-turn-helix domain-containing protein n=1 Tax=Sorangium sp. So ce1097 TaxID=3133330 RepID=UPI003F5DCCAA